MFPLVILFVGNCFRNYGEVDSPYIYLNFSKHFDASINRLLLGLSIHLCKKKSENTDTFSVMNWNIYNEIENIEIWFKESKDTCTPNFLLYGVRKGQQNETSILSNGNKKQMHVL